MKKFFLFAFLALTVSVNAQLNLSLRSGISFPVITADNGADYSPSSAYLPEMGVGYSLGDFSINTGVQFTWIDYYANVEHWYYWNDQTLQWQYTYVGIPLYVSYKHNFNQLYLGADLGADFMFNTSANFYAYYTYYPYYVDGQRIQQANSFIPMLLAGAKIGFDFSSRFSMDFTYRYNYAFSETEHDIKNFPATSTRTHANSFLLGFNYKF